jgi:hypothetical protein
VDRVQLSPCHCAPPPPRPAGKEGPCAHAYRARYATSRRAAHAGSRAPQRGRAQPLRRGQLAFEQGDLVFELILSGDAGAGRSAPARRGLHSGVGARLVDGLEDAPLVLCLCASGTKESCAQHAAPGWRGGESPQSAGAGARRVSAHARWRRRCTRSTRGARGAHRSIGGRRSASPAFAPSHDPVPSAGLFPARLAPGRRCVTVHK